MAATSIGFRWLDILEKEFDTAFVDLDILISDFDSEEPGMLFSARQKLTTLSSCFAQLTHKAQTIFQNSAKVEAELIHLRAELVDLKAKRMSLTQELHTLLLQVHASQLQNIPGVQGLESEAERIRQRLEDEMQRSPTNARRGKEGDEESSVLDIFTLQSEVAQLRKENGTLRNTLVAVQSEVYGARLTAKYLDKELAGRIQQLQLLGREMRGEVRDQLWRQLEAEILLQRHKTIVRACRNRSVEMLPAGATLPEPPVTQVNKNHSVGELRNVVILRESGEGLGMSITGGREHGVPILISELEPQGPAARSGALYVGDAILTANGEDLKQVCHQEAVDILTSHNGDMNLEVQYLAAEDSDDEENSFGGDSFYSYRYRYFDDEVVDSNDGITLHPSSWRASETKKTQNASTPTAPRTPELLNPQNSSPEILPSSVSEETQQSSVSGTGSDDQGLLSNGESSEVLHSALSDSSAGYIDTSIEPSQYSPMHVSTDGSNVARSSNSEESLIKNSPCKQPTVNIDISEPSSSISSTPNYTQNCTNGDDAESYNDKSIRISTLQHFFDEESSSAGNTVSTAIKSCILDNRKPYQLREPEPVKNNEEPQHKKEGKTSLKQGDFESKYTKEKVRSIRPGLMFPGRVRRQTVEIEEIYDNNTAGDSALLPRSSHNHHSGRSQKSTKKNENLGRTSSADGNANKKRGRKVDRIDTSSLVVGNSPTKHSDVGDYLFDSFGDPNFGTRV